MSNTVVATLPITIQEAMCFWGKTKKQVYWAIWREEIKARQSVCSENWILDFASCAAKWGTPVMLDLSAEVLEDWNNGTKISG